MPVHELRYRSWEGEVLPVPVRLLSVPRYTLMAVFNKYIAAVLLGIGVLQLIGYGGYLVIVTMPELQAMLELPAEPVGLKDEQVFRYFYSVQYYICLLMVLLAAPRMISPELAHRSIAIIFSRAIPRSGYILGKVAALGGLLSLLTWVQTCILFSLMYVLYPPDHTFHQQFWTESFPLLWKSLLLGITVTLLLTFVGLAGSAITKNARHAVVYLLIAFLGPGLATNMISNVFEVNVPAISLRHLTQDLGYLLFNPGEMLRDTGFVWITIAALAWVALTFGIIFLQLRPHRVYRE